MAELSIRQMFEAGVHFGHQTRLWNPEVAPYIYGQRNKIHIINLDTTLPMFQTALDHLKSLSASGSKVLFVGTKRAARESVERNAERCNMPYVSHRWLGGMMTNFKTIRLSVKRYISLQEQQQNDSGSGMTKKQILQRSREIIKLGRNFRGIRDMVRLPEALFIIDVRHERIAVNEAIKLGIPTVAVVDTNGFCEGIDYVIPGNDDAIRAVDLYVSAAADAILEGVRMQKKEEEVTEFESKETSEALKGVITVASGNAPARETIPGSEEKSPRIRMKGLTRRVKAMSGQESATGEEAETAADQGGEIHTAEENAGDAGDGQDPGEK